MSEFRVGDIVQENVDGEIFQYLIAELWEGPVDVKMAKVCCTRVNGRTMDKRSLPLVREISNGNFTVIAHPGEEYHAYLRGFKDGVIMTAKRDNHALNVKAWIRVAYLTGYEEGMEARGKYVGRFCRRIDYKPSILR